MTTICIVRECFEDICDLLEVCDEICYFTNEQGKKWWNLKAMLKRLMKSAKDGDGKKKNYETRVLLKSSTFCL